jgi:hypothetical protein
MILLVMTAVQKSNFVNKLMFGTVKCVRFQVFMVSSMKTIGFWDIAPCSLTEVD